MNPYDSGANGTGLPVQLMALQTLHHAWLDSSANGAGGPEGAGAARRWFRAALLLAVVALPLALIVFRVVTF